MIKISKKQLYKEIWNLSWRLRDEYNHRKSKDSKKKNYFDVFDFISTLDNSAILKVENHICEIRNLLDFDDDLGDT